MMPEAVAFSKAVIEVGFLASAAVVVLGLLVWHQYKLVPLLGALLYSSQRLIESADKLALDMDKHGDDAKSVFIKATEMHETCKEHGGQLDDMRDSMTEFRAKLLDRLARLEQEVALLKAKVE